MAENEQLKVFVSYSRADSEIADEIVAGLEFAERFDVFIDREAIHEGEAWQARLQSLIETSDAIVFLLSPHSAGSEVCHWEVELAASLSKRIIPVLLDAPGQAEAPATLSELNYVRLDEGRSFMKGLAGLRSALLTDLNWLREHTRLLTRATEWNGAGRPDTRLLMGEEVTIAREWLNSTPSESVAPTALHREFIVASEAAQEMRISKERQRAKEFEDQAKELARQVESMRLPRDLIIQTRHGKEEGLLVNGHWFEMLNTFQNSVVIICDDKDRPRGTGFILDGKVLHSKFVGQPVLGSASHVISSAKFLHAIDSKSVSLRFPLAVGILDNRFRVEPIWESNDERGISFFRMDTLPKSVVLIDRVADGSWSEKVLEHQTELENVFQNGTVISDFGRSNYPLIGYASIRGSTPSFVITVFGGVISTGHRPRKLSLLENKLDRESQSNTSKTEYNSIWTPAWGAPGASGAPLFDPVENVLVSAHLRRGDLSELGKSSALEDEKIRTRRFRSKSQTRHTPRQPDLRHKNPISVGVLLAPFIKAAREDLSKEFAFKESVGEAPPPVGTQT